MLRILQVSSLVGGGAVSLRMSVIFLLMVSLACSGGESESTPIPGDHSDGSTRSLDFEASDPGDVAHDIVKDQIRGGSETKGFMDSASIEQDADSGSDAKSSSDRGSTGEDVEIPQTDSGCSDDSFCQDENPCTQGICKADGSCFQSVLFEQSCEDGDLCTIDDRCAADGTCASGALWDEDGDGVGPADCGGQDCDDADPLVGPFASERCNGVDDNCDGAVDELPLAAIDCTVPNDLDIDGLCAGDSGDPTGNYESAQIIDLGKSFGDVLVNFSVGGSSEACDGAVRLDSSEDGVVWSSLWSGEFGKHHLPVPGSLRYLRAGSDACSISVFVVDIACFCEGPLSADCNQANAFDDDSCCCFDTFHTLDMGDVHELEPEQSLECCITTGYTCGCKDESSFEISQDGLNWDLVLSEETVSQKEGGGPFCDQSKGWVSHCFDLPTDKAFRYLRGTNTDCYVDYFSCTITPACQGKYACEGADALDCDDGDLCTIDSCDSNMGCRHEALCDDGDPCSIDECTDGACWLSGIKDCEDGLLCTVDSCNPENGSCDHVEQVFEVPECDDDQGCTTDRCIIACSVEGGACVHECSHEALQCPDEGPCLDESCDLSSGECTGEPVECDDENVCTIDSCVEGIGCVFEARDCSDQNPCTQDSCDEETSFDLACGHSPFELLNPYCDDSNPCTVDTCDSSGGGACVYSSLDCDDGVACTVDSCEPATGTCLHDANSAGCDDSVPCTDDACDAQGGCIHTARDCGDGNPCTLDSCDSNTGYCQHTLLDCADDDLCNGLEVCDPASGECGAGEPKVCDDGNPCNGLETCSTPSGECIPGLSILCDDGDGCNGMESCDPSTGQCVDAPVPLCPLAESECKQSAGMSPGSSNTFLSSDLAGSIRLRDTEEWDEKYSIVQELKNHPELESAQISEVISDLNREGDRSYIVFGTECYNAGFSFNFGDDWVSYWYPQGVSGTATAYQDGTFYGVPLALVSWYHKPEEDSSTSKNKGSRVSIINTDDFDDIRYRHTLLVEPLREDDGTPNFKPVEIHAGGIAWYGKYLYVADTSKGFRVFDMTEMIRVSTGKSNSIGLHSNGKYYAFNYKYVIPQVGRYRLCSTSCCARFSFVALDRTTNPPALVSGAYSDANTNARIHRWIVDPATKRLKLEQGVASPAKLLYPNVMRMQGVVSAYGSYFISSSQPKTSWVPSPGSLYYGTANGSSVDTNGYPGLPEDLHYSPFSDNLWSVTELPGMRNVFTVKRSSVLYGCSD